MMLTIIGIDPGLAHTGYAVLRWPLRCLDADTFTSGTGDGTRRERVMQLSLLLTGVVQEWRHGETVVAVEEQHRAWSGAQARGRTNDKAVWNRDVVGAVCGIATAYGLRLIEVTPAQKNAAVGLPASTSKQQVQRAVRAIVPGLPKRLSQHAADAVAVAMAGERVVRGHESKVGRGAVVGNVRGVR